MTYTQAMWRIFMAKEKIDFIIRAKSGYNAACRCINSVLRQKTPDYNIFAYVYNKADLEKLEEEYPDIKLYIAGYKPFSDNDKRSFIKKGYGAYLKKLIDDLGVEDHIVFTGPLKANDVADKLASVHSYVLCSAIENSPNTLGEAMMIGTPCVSSYVGGAPDMAVDGEEALFYRNDDPKLLAWRIKQIFDNDELALYLSENAKKRARITHDAKKNADKLVFAYKDIMKGKRD